MCHNFYLGVYGGVWESVHGHRGPGCGQDGDHDGPVVSRPQTQRPGEMILRNQSVKLEMFMRGVQILHFCASI